MRNMSAHRQLQPLICQVARVIWEGNFADHVAGISCRIRIRVVPEGRSTFFALLSHGQNIYQPTRKQDHEASVTASEEDRLRRKRRRSVEIYAQSYFASLTQPSCLTKDKLLVNNRALTAAVFIVSSAWSWSKGSISGPR